MAAQCSDSSRVISVAPHAGGDEPSLSVRPGVHNSAAVHASPPHRRITDNHEELVLMRTRLGRLLRSVSRFAAQGRQTAIELQERLRIGAELAQALDGQLSRAKTARAEGAAQLAELEQSAAASVDGAHARLAETLDHFEERLQRIAEQTEAAVHGRLEARAKALTDLERRMTAFEAQMELQIMTMDRSTRKVQAMTDAAEINAVRCAWRNATREYESRSTANCTNRAKRAAVIELKPQSDTEPMTSSLPTIMGPLRVNQDAPNVYALAGAD